MKYLISSLAAVLAVLNASPALSQPNIATSPAGAVIADSCRCTGPGDGRAFVIKKDCPVTDDLSPFMVEDFGFNAFPACSVDLVTGEANECEIEIVTGVNRFGDPLVTSVKKACQVWNTISQYEQWDMNNNQPPPHRNVPIMK